MGAVAWSVACWWPRNGAAAPLVAHSRLATMHAAFSSPLRFYCVLTFSMIMCVCDSQFGPENRVALMLAGSLYAGDSVLYRTADGGRSWQLASSEASMHGFSTRGGFFNISGTYEMRPICANDLVRAGCVSMLVCVRAIFSRLSISLTRAAYSTSSGAWVHPYVRISVHKFSDVAFRTHSTCGNRRVWVLLCRCACVMCVCLCGRCIGVCFVCCVRHTCMVCGFVVGRVDA